MLLLVSGAQLGELEMREDLFDDFCLAPFHQKELEARLRHLFWRTGPGRAPEIVEYGDLVLNLETYQAALGGRPLDLTYMEYELLKFFATHPGKVFTREQLLSRVWGYEYYGGARTVDVHVRRLRAKLGEEHASLIQTVRSVGYRFGSPALDARRLRLARRPSSSDDASGAVSARAVGVVAEQPAHQRAPDRSASMTAMGKTTSMMTTMTMPPATHDTSVRPMRSRSVDVSVAAACARARASCGRGTPPDARPRRSLTAFHAAAATAANTASDARARGVARDRRRCRRRCGACPWPAGSPNERMVRSWTSPVSGSTARPSVSTQPSAMCAAPIA